MDDYPHIAVGIGRSKIWAAYRAIINWIAIAINILNGIDFNQLIGQGFGCVGWEIGMRLLVIWDAIGIEIE
jgi:hypothetical protein